MFRLGSLPRLARLPASRSRTGGRSARRDAGTALAAGVVAFALLHAGMIAAAQTAFVADPLFADKQWRLTQVESSAPGAARVVFLGTSRSLNGFAAGETGLPGTFNFGIPGSGPVTHALYLRRLHADGHTPDLLLLEIMPATLIDTPAGPAEAHVLAPDRLSWDETRRAIRRYEFPAGETRARRAACDRWPWDAHRFKLLGRFAPAALPWNLRFDTSRECDPRGWLPPLSPTPDPSAATREAARYRDGLRDWRPGRGAVAALRDTLALSRESGSAVALVLMPESTAFRALYSPAARERLDRFVAELAAEFGCGVIDARHWVNDDDFADGHHLLRAGALAFTRQLTEESLQPLLRAHGRATR